MYRRKALTFNRFSTLAFALYFTTVAPALPSSVQYEVTSLTAPAGTIVRAAAMNNMGQIVGFLDIDLGSDRWTRHAFLYSKGAIHDLGTLGGLKSVANAINDAGDVVGYSNTATSPHSAFLYSQGAMKDLGLFGGRASDALGINSSGQTTGQWVTSGGDTHAFLYTNGKVQDLGTTADAEESVGVAVNDAGMVVGRLFGSRARYSGLVQHAFQFYHGRMTDIGALEYQATGAGEEGQATAVNRRGDIVGKAIVDGGYHATLYRQGKLTRLPDEAAMFSEARGINAAGQIVGCMQLRIMDDRIGDYRAFLYDHGKLTDINSLLEPNSPSLTCAIAINDAGVIVAQASDTFEQPQPKNLDMTVYVLTPVDANRRPQQVRRP